MSHQIKIRVYYEDTDMAGIVYYANYLKFIERGRSEFVRSHGVDQTRLRAEKGIVFAVRHLTADYLSPAKFDDELAIQTEPVSVSGARLILEQKIFRSGALLFKANVTLVAFTDNGKPTRLPADIRLLLAEN